MTALRYPKMSSHLPTHQVGMNTPGRGVHQMRRVAHSATCHALSASPNVIRLWLLSILCWCLATALFGTNVTLRLEDQNGLLIPGSSFQILTATNQSVLQLETIHLPAGSHSILVRPGIGGKVIRGNILERRETVAIAGISQAVRFIWRTAPLTIKLIDETGASIPGSVITIGSYGPRGNFDLITIPTATTTTLPVTN